MGEISAKFKQAFDAVRKISQREGFKRLSNLKDEN